MYLYLLSTTRLFTVHLCFSQTPSPALLPERRPHNNGPSQVQVSGRQGCSHSLCPQSSCASCCVRLADRAAWLDGPAMGQERRDIWETSSTQFEYLPINNHFLYPTCWMSQMYPTMHWASRCRKHPCWLQSQPHQPPYVDSENLTGSY